MGIKSFTLKFLRKFIKYGMCKIYSDNPVVSNILNNSNTNVIKLLNSSNNDNLFINANSFGKSTKDVDVYLYSPYKLHNTHIGDYTYIAKNSHINNTTIGKFCSIGPNFVCGWGIHPTNGISTAPMFYSTMKQNGITLSPNDKIAETKHINIRNDVFIGMNVTILDGVTIGNGAVVGAGSVVTKDIPPYAIVTGIPAKIIRYRFDESTILKLTEIKWWDWNIEKLKDVEQMFFDIDSFVNKYYKAQG